MEKKKILVVDDEEDIRFILRRFLEERDYEVLEAKGGPQCLEMIEKEKPDLIILDILMPEMNGWDVCRQIKENEALQDIPVSMLSILSDTRDVQKSFKYSSANSHLPKPIDFPRLTHTIETLLEESKKIHRKSDEPAPPNNSEDGFFAPFKFDSSQLN